MCRPVLLMILSSTCPHCVSFKANELDKLKSGLGSADLIEANVVGGSWPANVPKEVKDRIYGYPCAMLIDRKRWDENIKGRPTPLEPSVFNGTSEGKPQYVPTYPMNAESIIRWANSTRPSPYQGKDQKVVLSNKGKQIASFTKSSVLKE